MACPKCGCRTTYPFDPGWDGEQWDDTEERCAACGEIFSTLDADEDDDIYETDVLNAPGGDACHGA